MPALAQLQGGSKTASYTDKSVKTGSRFGRAIVLITRLSWKQVVFWCVFVCVWQIGLSLRYYLFLCGVVVRVER